ncbi:MAG: TraR/DksA family transcriptional regulator [Actinomycetota bacterium]
MSLDLDSTRATLEAERVSLESELVTLTAVTRDPTATIGFGKRVGEGTNEAIGRIERVGQADALSAKLSSVRRAIEKLDQGTYGICDDCAIRIGDDRLRARPASVVCVRCSARG